MGLTMASECYDNDVNLKDHCIHIHEGATESVHIPTDFVEVVALHVEECDSRFKTRSDAPNMGLHRRRSWIRRDIRRHRK